MCDKSNKTVVIIGAGPAGYTAAFRCSDLGLNTILIENYCNLGGVCLNVGCIPSKSLLYVSKTINQIKELSICGISFSSFDINIKKLINWKKENISKLNFALSHMAKKRGIKVINGVAKFKSENELVILKNDVYVSNLEFKNAIIATGSKSVKLAFLPYESKKVWTSTEALSIPYIPKKLLIIGGGVIGLEMATIYHSLGSKIDITDNHSHIFPSVDNDVIQIFLNAIKNKFNVMLETNILDVKEVENGMLVTIDQKEKGKKTILYDAILVAVGRVPSLGSLGIKEIGVKINNKGFIKVNEQLKTNIKNIYAVGDVTGQPMLAHKGIHQGKIAAEVIAGKEHFFDPEVVPNVAYTEPEIAWTGIIEKDAKKLNINYKVATFPWIASGRAIASNCSLFGSTKLIFNKDTKRLIGGVIIGRNAGELLSEISLAIEMGCDAQDISLTIHPHPTLSETISLAAEICEGTITDLIN
ncbi:dihydrolipoyl dehydrogenase [Buchnera aphidicola (Mindarus keteleerifoliae)]|uniref:dihydrolipoyl dehydrogenase n=1 Tax=Buchnera aphidicola TaxID=9 RepID=UPI0031B686FE